MWSPTRTLSAKRLYDFPKIVVFSLGVEILGGFAIKDTNCKETE